MNVCLGVQRQQRSTQRRRECAEGGVAVQVSNASVLATVVGRAVRTETEVRTLARCAWRTLRGGSRRGSTAERAISRCPLRFFGVSALNAVSAHHGATS